MDKIYSFVLIYWSQLFIYCQNLSLILIKREIYQFTQKLPREWVIQGFKNYKNLLTLLKLNDSKHSQFNIVSITL